MSSAAMPGRKTSAGQVEGDAVRPPPDYDLDERAGTLDVEDRHAVLAAIRGEDEVPRLGDQRARDAGQARDRIEVSALGEVGDIVVGGAGDVEPAVPPMNGGLIEPTLALMLGSCFRRLTRLLVESFYEATRAPVAETFRAVLAFPTIRVPRA
jgi:hypothetical protein